jgi:CubicO group peptidase (beta-lactamase class C family)
VAVPEAEGWIGAAGGLWSTPTDLLAWDLALMDGKVVSGSSYHTMTTPRRLIDGRSTGYGCGLSVRDSGPAVVLSHGGAVSGFVASNTFVPATRSGVVLLANADFAAIGALGEAIVPMLLPPGPNLPVISGPSALDAAMAMMRQLQTGYLDRTQLGEEFSAFLTPERVKAGAASLGPLGGPKSVEVPVRWRRHHRIDVPDTGWTNPGVSRLSPLTPEVSGHAAWR